MATSTLFDHIVINNSKVLEDYAAYREEAAKKPEHYEPSVVCTDRTKLREFMEKALEKRNEK